MAAPRVAAPHRLGPYELVERIGAGGMAEVYLGRRAGPRGFSKRFAIKRILPQLASDPHFVAMFCDEARTSALLAHPNIVQVVDFGEHDGELFMAMEYVDGVSGAKLLRAVAARRDRVPLGAALFIGHEVLRALAFAHEARDDQGRPLGIVHRDVSPGNVLIGRAGEVKLGDFGIARGAFIDRRTSPGELKGKIGYMSPEQAVGEDLDHRSDLFTTAIVLTELLLACPLFAGRDELEILTRIHRADLSVLEHHASLVRPDLLAVLRKALSREPDDRFQSAGEFAEALRVTARRAGSNLSDSELVPWLASLDLLPASGLRPAVRQERRAGDEPGNPAQEPTRRREGAARRSYEIVLPDGRSLGSVGLPRLVELVVTGRLAARSRIAVAGRAPVAVGELPELARFAGRSAFAFGTAPVPLAPLERRTLPSVLYQLAASRRSGLLVLRDGPREKRVTLREGAPVLIASTERDELLGQRLVARGLLAPHDLELAVGRAVERGRRLGSVLVELQLLRPAALLRALGEQIEDRFVSLGAWHHGGLAFWPEPPTKDDGSVPLGPPLALVTRLVRAHYADREIRALLADALSSPLARGPIAELDGASSGLDAEEGRWLALAAGVRSLGELVSRAEAGGVLSSAKVMRTVFIALSAGWLVSPAFARPVP